MILLEGNGGKRVLSLFAASLRVHPNLGGPVKCDLAGLRSKALTDGALLIVGPAGRFFLASPAFDERMSLGMCSDEDLTWLVREGHVAATSLARHAGIFARARRETVAAPLDYLILIPTLRCNLACSYCQVSRADFRSQGFDWDERTLEAVQTLVRSLKVPAAKIEFQGGEPTLRPDLIQAVMDAAPVGIEMTYVICSNLQEIDEATIALFDRPDVQISTSLDGSLATHSRQRQRIESKTAQFLANLDWLLDRYGPQKISALPTVDPVSPPTPSELIHCYASRSLTSIYLRPINYQGFARKRHAQAIALNESWRTYHEAFIEALIERNWQLRGEQVLEETYFSLLLKRIFRPGQDRHLDLRDPNPVGRDYVVIDYDGQAYPSDEARMLARSGVIDLSIGDVFAGWDTPQRDALERAATNRGDPQCDRCAYQPYCGRDMVDDISRYGTIDQPRRDTEFCRRHIHLFDLAFRLIYSTDEKVQYSLRRWLGLAGDTVALGQSR